MVHLEKLLGRFADYGVSERRMRKHGQRDDAPCGATLFLCEGQHYCRQCSGQPPDAAKN
jgi:hypothetical protein